MGCAKLTYDGVVNLTLGQTPSKSAIDGAETPESKQGTKIEEPTIKKKENVDDSNTRGVDQKEQPLQPKERPQLRRSTREHRPSTRYPNSEYMLIVDEGEPRSFQEVQSHKDKD